MKYLKLPFKLMSIIMTSMISWIIMVVLFFTVTVIEITRNVVDEVLNTIEKE